MRFVFVVAALVLAGCVSTTVEVASPPATLADDGGADASTDTGPATSDATGGDAPADKSESYAAICVLALGGQDPAQAWRFAARVTREGDKLDISMTPIRGWDAVTNAPLEQSKLSLSATVGNPVSASGVLVDAGRFTANFGALSLPAEANSLSGKVTVVENVTLAGVAKLPNGNMCGSLAGQQTTPYAMTLNASENTCLLIPSNAVDLFPNPAKSAFVCP